MPVDLRTCLAALVAQDGSDLHLKVGRPPLGRIDGVLRPLLPDHPPLDAADTDAVLQLMLRDDAARQAFAAEDEMDLAHEEPGIARLRVNAFRQRGSVSIVCRVVPGEPRALDELGLPPVIGELADEERGLVLVTGITGSGKSTTLAGMVDRINRARQCHVVTIEDPIEMLHSDRLATINQREVGSDTRSFGQALRRVLRQDPDVILIGELRDEETVRAALSAAETGHLVLSTVHTLDATGAVDRLVGFFPPHQHQPIREALALTLQGVVSQRLVPLAAGKGRMAVCEVLRATGLVRDIVRDPARLGELGQVIAEGKHYGMQTFDQALCRFVLDGVVTHDDAMRAAARPHDLELLLRADGRMGTSMDDVADQQRRGAGGEDRQAALPAV
ncbi:Twitching motility protein PilT [Patulibacter medicamentivorans]|uniref:Twitching motility protein PilT n=1 Tax=Patulibacter medicamentivorans TaxID=1097667 RepID=H0E408_9ACTN|nr:PilT/PilU family type 4a pilus ATPase [Patulibacter medicamentivorans]EHN11573.1 Twitching motility protein PilT [Patulibacter medicamentivorans]